MSIWWIMFLGGMLTYTTRLSFILLFGEMQIPVLVKRALKFVPPSVLTALIFPELLMKSGNVDISPNNFRLLAGLIAMLIAWRTRNMWATILGGMIILVVLQVLV